MPREKTSERDMLPPGEKYALYSETKYKCAHCGRNLRYGEATVDHIIPISKGGAHVRENWTILCEACNQEKYNHIIAPKDYYAYLPEAKLKQAQAMFEDYLKNNDWLSWENLFRTDRFELESKHAIINPKSGKMFMVPTHVKIRKLLPTEAYNWLQLYRAHIRVPDRDLVISDPREVEHPFYEISQGKTPIAIFECFMDVEKNIIPEMPEQELPTVDVNFFSHWDLKYRDRISKYNMFYIVKAIIEEIRHTLEQSAGRSLVGLTFKSVFGDPHVPAMLTVTPENYMHRFTQKNFEGADPDAKIVGFTAMLFQGTNADLRELMKEAGAATEQELVAKADYDAMTKPVLDNLAQQSDEIKPDRIMYRDMNRSYTRREKKRKRR